MHLPPLLSPAEIRARLAAIFPPNLSQARHVVSKRSERGARVVFTMLYIGAIEGGGVYLVPKHVYRMTAEQAADTSTAARRFYREHCEDSGFYAHGKRWYGDNSREQIRDETLRQGLVALGAVVVDESVATTANEGRYSLRPDFAALFDPSLAGAELAAAIEAWRKKRLAPAALAKVMLHLAMLAASSEAVMVKMPDGTTRKMSPGPSSVITKAVAEEFAPRFLHVPAIIWISESRKKIVEKDVSIAKQLGLDIEADKLLPDIIAADLGDQALLVFVEVVATDGPITDARKAELLAKATVAGFDESNTVFLTAFASREEGVFRKLVGALALGSFAWFADEPDTLLWIRGGKVPPQKIADLRFAGD